MPVFENSLELPCSAESLFDFFLQPANLLKISPPDLNVTLLEAPERLALGSRITIVGRRWGLSQKMTTEVVAFELARVLTDEQRDGPFRRFRHERSFSPSAAGVMLTERIEFEPPGGLMGLMLTASKVKQSLEEVGAFRFQALTDLFVPRAGD